MLSTIAALRRAGVGMRPSTIDGEHATGYSSMLTVL